MTAVASEMVLDLAIGLPSGWEWIVVLFIGLLLFGRRLPEVGRSLGRGIVEFKKGIKGIEEEIDEEADKPAAPQRLEDRPVVQARPAAREKIAAENSQSINDQSGG